MFQNNFVLNDLVIPKTNSIYMKSIVELNIYQRVWIEIEVIHSCIVSILLGSKLHLSLLFASDTQLL